VGGSPEPGVVMGDTMGGPWSVTWVTTPTRTGVLEQRSQRIRIPHARDRFGYEWHCSAVEGRGGRVTHVRVGQRGEHGRPSWSWSVTWVRLSPQRRIWKQIAAQIRIPHAWDRLGCEWGISAMRGSWWEGHLSMRWSWETSW
jgi:hypothetical protein